MSLDAQHAVHRNLDTVGDGTGSIDGAVDGSVTPVILKYAPGIRAELTHMFVHIDDNAATFSADNYGAIVGPLTNGISIGVFAVDDTLIHSLVNGTPVHSNADWAHHTYDVRFLGFGVGNESLAIKWDFDEEDPDNRGLVIKNGEYLAVTIADDLSTLVEHSFKVVGAVFDR